VIVGHVMGLPIEENVMQLAPAGGAIMAWVVIAGRAGLARLRRRVTRHAPPQQPRL
jgi:hypothetical protein